MEKKEKEKNKRLSAVGWGTLFIWVGLVNLVPGFPPGVGWIGVGCIFLGISLIRYMSKMAARWDNVIIGSIALLIGITKLLSLHLALFPLSLVIIGVILLLRSAF